MNFYVNVLNKVNDFNGRSSRKEYWMFHLFNIIWFIFFEFLAILTGLFLISWAYRLFILIPSISVLIRRLHDTGRSGWWILVALIPIVGAIILLFFTLLPSNKGENQYGPNPYKL